MNREITLSRRIKFLTWLFIIGLVISGVTATALPINSNSEILVVGFEIDGVLEQNRNCGFRFNLAHAATSPYQ